MPGGELLLNLNAAAVAVHVAEAADVHQDVEAELLAGAEGAQHLVMAAAMAQASIDDLAAACFADALDCLANLAIRIVAVLVQQRGGQFDLQRVLRRAGLPQAPRLARRCPSIPTRSGAVRGGSRFRTDWGRHTSPASARRELLSAVRFSARAPSSGETARISSTSFAQTS